MTKFKNKYRIESNRLKGWNYANNALYFITIVTQNRECNLGRIENNKMILSDFGKIVNDEWYKSFEIRDELFLHQYILMPNHIHAILEIKNNIVENNEIMDDNVGMMDDNKMVDDDENENENENENVETNGRSSLRFNQSPRQTQRFNQSPRQTQRFKQSPPKPHPQRQPKSISSFIGGFKSSVNSKIDDYIDAHNLNIPKYNRNNHFFQPNYHDHIIRDKKSYQNISNYIIQNPLKWNDDKFNPQNPNSEK